MKKTVLFAFIAFGAAMGFVSCNDDDNNNSGNNSIVGEWEWVKETEYENGTSVLVDYEHAEGCEKDYMIFTADGVLTDVYYENTPENSCVEYKSNGTYSTNGDIITVTEDDGYTYSANFTVTNDELRITSVDPEEDYSFVSILKRK